MKALNINYSGLNHTTCFGGEVPPPPSPLPLKKRNDADHDLVLVMAPNEMSSNFAHMALHSYTYNS